MYYLFTTVTWKIECQYSEKGYPHTWYDYVNSIKQSFSSQRYIKGDVKVRLITAGVKLFIPKKKKRKLQNFQNKIKLSFNFFNIHFLFF